jgi:DNA-binding MarR family transcriptional regulator
MSVMKTPTDFTSDADLEVAMRVGIAWRELRRGSVASNARDAIYGVGGSAIEPGQMDALDLLVTVPSCRMSEIAEYLHIDPSSATRAVQRLVKDNLVEYVAHEGDGRVVYIAASERGRRIHGEVAERRRSILLRVLSDFSEEERQQFAELFERFTASIDTAVTEKLRSRRRH